MPEQLPSFFQLLSSALAGGAGAAGAAIVRTVADKIAAKKVIKKAEVKHENEAK